MLEIIPLKEEHLEDAARLVSQRYVKLLEQVPLLPKRYADVSVLLPLLHDILHSSGCGAAAFRGKRLVGFLTAWRMPAFRDRRSIYSPEWANAVDLEDSAYIYEELYNQQSSVWAANGFSAFYFSLFPNDVDALQAFYRMNFGMMSVDGLCGVEPIKCQTEKSVIRRAEMTDLPQVIELHEALFAYMKGAPVFWLTARRERSDYEEWLQDPSKVVWLACIKNEPVACLRVGPADPDVCTIIVDEKTASIYAAFTKEGARRGGAATALLQHALEWARQAGYERCAVPYEPMNLLGSRFWSKHFQPVCYSICRILDDRLF